MAIEATLERKAQAGTKPLLKVRGLEAWYGESHVLHGIDLDVGEGEVVTLLGRNGAGKTTTLKSIMGVIGKRKGSVSFGGQETIGLPSRAIARLGLGYVPEERGIYERDLALSSKHLGWMRALDQGRQLRIGFFQPTVPLSRIAGYREERTFEPGAQRSSQTRPLRSAPSGRNGRAR